MLQDTFYCLNNMKLREILNTLRVISEIFKLNHEKIMVNSVGGSRTNGMLSFKPFVQSDFYTSTYSFYCQFFCMKFPTFAWRSDASEENTGVEDNTKRRHHVRLSSFTCDDNL